MQTTRRLYTRELNLSTKYFHVSSPIYHSGTSVAAAARCYASSKKQRKDGHDMTEDKASGKDREQKSKFEYLIQDK